MGSASSLRHTRTYAHCRCQVRRTSANRRTSAAETVTLSADIPRRSMHPHLCRCRPFLCKLCLSECLFGSAGDSAPLPVAAHRGFDRPGANRADCCALGAARRECNCAIEADEHECVACEQRTGGPDNTLGLFINTRRVKPAKVAIHRRHMLIEKQETDSYCVAPREQHALCCCLASDSSTEGEQFYNNNSIPCVRVNSTRSKSSQLLKGIGRSFLRDIQSNSRAAVSVGIVLSQSITRFEHVRLTTWSWRLRRTMPYASSLLSRWMLARRMSLLLLQ